MNGRAQGGEPDFFVLDYITITRDPRTKLVVAIGGDERVAGILQTAGGFIDAPGPRGPYHRQPHTMAVDQQRTGATAAALALGHRLAAASNRRPPPGARPAPADRPSLPLITLVSGAFRTPRAPPNPTADHS
ncbi:MAG: hypothetical protein HOY75_22255 [Streptomyces sp.]|nr:hypothetical protein [Streptomyces sp.]